MLKNRFPYKVINAQQKVITVKLLINNINNNNKNSTNLGDSARRFRKKGWERTAMENDEAAAAQIPLPKDQERIHLEWTTEMKVTLITFDNEKRAKGRGFMKRVKER